MRKKKGESAGKKGKMRKKGENHSDPIYTNPLKNLPNSSETEISGLQKGPAERGHVKNRQKVPKSFSTLFDNFFAQGKKTSKIAKNMFDTFRQFSRGTNIFRPFLGGSDKTGTGTVPCC